MSRIGTAIETCLWTWVDGATSTAVTTVWDKQSTKRPNLPYVTLNIIDGPRREGTPALAYSDGNDYNIQFKKAFTLSVNVFAQSNHLALMDDICNSMFLESNRAAFRAADVQVREHADVIELSELLDTQFEFRCQCDFFCAYSEDVTDTIGYINEISYSATFTHEDSSTYTVTASFTG